MARILYENVDWFGQAVYPDGRPWELRSDFYNRDFDICDHTNGASYLFSVGVNQRTGGWDAVLFKAPGDGRILVYHYFRLNLGLLGKAASVAISEPPSGPFRGALHVAVGMDAMHLRAGEGGLFNPFSKFVEP